MFNLSVVNIIPDAHRDSINQIAELYGCGENNLSIRINAILPGYVNTPISYDEAAQNNQTIEEFTSEAVKCHSIGYLGTQMILHMIMYTYPQMRLNL